MRQLDPLLSQVNVLTATGGIRRMEFASGAEAEQSHFTVLKARLYPLSFGGRNRWLDAMFMPGAEFHCFEPGRLELFDDGFEVPIFQNVIGDCAQEHTTIVLESIGPTPQV